MSAKEEFLLSVLKEVASYDAGEPYQIECYGNQLLLQKEDIDTLLAYIKRLESYGELLAENFRLEHNCKVLENRIDQAIELIEKEWYSLNTTRLQDILVPISKEVKIWKILKGGSNE